MSAAAPLRFSKMHGTGNDFVIVDCRRGDLRLRPGGVARMADRHRGVGFDQLITIDAPRSAGAVAGYSIYNADGSRAAQCGNGARCVAAWLIRDGAAPDGDFVLDSPAGQVLAQRQGGEIGIDMGAPDFSPAAIRLTLPSADMYQFDLGDQIVEAGAVSMGNPHAVIEVADVSQADVVRLGSALQRHPGFLDSCNVGFVEVVDPSSVRLRVFERGAGETLACGSGACAAVAVLRRRGRVAQQVTVHLPGGVLRLNWSGLGQPMHMAGPAEFVFEGELVA